VGECARSNLDSAREGQKATVVILDKPGGGVKVEKL
jgi:hypothetical protein